MALTRTRTQSGNLGDIVVWGANGEDYKQAIKNGLLLEWDEDGLAETYAPYVWANYQDALSSNRLVSEDDNNLYGFGMDVATSRQAISPSCTPGICAGICILSSATRKSRIWTI